MNNKLLKTDNIFTDDDIRKVVMNSVASSPTVSSTASSASVSPNKPFNVSIESCIAYLRFKMPPNLPNDEVLDKFIKLMKECAPNERINWRNFRQAADPWIASVKSKCPGGHNKENVNNGDTADSPDEGITSDDPDIFHKDFNDSGKSSELVECSIVPINRITSSIAKECNKVDVSTKLPRETDIENATEVELLRKRVYHYEKDNAWLRDELIKSEDSANSYKQLFYSFRQKYDRRNEQYRYLERENDEKKELIDSMKKEQECCQISLGKWEKERKSFVEKIETDKQNFENFKIKYDKAVSDKKEFYKQLTTCRSKFKEKEVECNVIQKELNQVKQDLANLEDYYEKTVSQLQEQNEDLKRKNFKLELKSSDGKSLSELHSIPSAINLNISSDHSPDVNFNNPSSDSLYDELKASGFLPDVSYENSKIRELEEELDWHDEKARDGIDKIEGLIKYLIEKKMTINDSRQLCRASSLQTKYIIILLDKISQLSEAVIDAFQKALTNEISCQVSADPLVNQNFKEFHILTFENLLNTDSSSGDIKDNPPSLHFTSAFESKIVSGTEVSFDETQKKSKLVVNKTRIVNNPSGILISKQKLLSKNTEWSPIICNTPIMTEKSAPRRKIGVFARSSDLDKILESQGSGENFTSSTPVADPIPESNTYRTTEDCSSDSSANLSQSQLQTSLEDNADDCRESTSSVINNQVNFNIAPAKFNFSSLRVTEEQPVSNDRLAVTDSDTTQFNSLGIEKKFIESSTPISDDETNNLARGSASMEKGFKNVTWTIKSDISSEAQQQQFNYNNNKCDIYAVNENVAVESAAVTLAMSSGEDSSDSSDSDSAITCDNKNNENDNNINSKNIIVNHQHKQTRESFNADKLSLADESLQVLSSPLKNNPSNGANKINDKTFTYKPAVKREILPIMKRSRSESENLGCGHESNLYICDVEKPKKNFNYQEFKLTVFPSLTDFRLQESGIAHLSDTEDFEEKDLVEGELERKYVAFSLGLCTDRLTLSRRKTLSQRRRDQTERNLANEVTRMQQSIEIARRRASIATIFRPIGIGQDVMKDGIKQRNSVAGRVTVRRPSLSESQRWEVEKLIRTESSNSVGELQEIFEHAESRRNSKEENRIITPVQVNNNSEGSLALPQTESCNSQEETAVALTSDQQTLQSSRRISRMLFTSANQPMTWRTLLWCITISFLIGFFMKDVVSLRPYDGPLRWSSFQEFIGRHEKVKNTAALPL
ncbi:uncharacterized protein LOC130677824 isoform X2 [Microplitis mediator]|uniref:uncharacterized protein LOC130677824 isoform X2 n=1 Tax=Microplitis mediator TaxID=375433 RepID=UPI002556449F|nr:uncharacterized protein LOC130677824 isoform X2 [Microplitis mediator]